MSDLIADKKKKIINSLVSKLAEENLDLYYIDSSTIASYVYEDIHNKKVSHSEYELVKDLTQSDILVLMSFKTNCC